MFVVRCSVFGNYHYSCYQSLIHSLEKAQHTAPEVDSISPAFEFSKENFENQKPLLIQPKLSVGAVDDPFEREADTMADRVMRMPDSSFIQRKCASCEHEEEQIHRKITPFIQKQGNGLEGGTASESVTNQINSSRGDGNRMSENTLSFMESRFNTDFSGVKIHTDSNAVQMSRELNAQAFTVGSDIYFNSGKYAPESESGKHLLAHELTHTVQQGGGVERKIQKWGIDNAPIGDPERDPRLRQFRTSSQRVSSTAISELPLAEKLTRSLGYAIQFLPSEIGTRIRELLTPQSLAIMTTFLAAYVVSQFTPAGWVTDIIVAGLIVASLYMLGPEVITIIRELMAFGSIANNARSESDLESSGRHFANAASRIGIDILMAIIFHRVGRSAVTQIRNLPPPPNMFSQMVTSEGFSMPVPPETVPISDTTPMQMSARTPRTGPGSAIDSLVGEGSEISRGMSERTARGAGASRPPRHHVFPQEFRAWFERRGFTRSLGLDIDTFTVEMSEGEHQAIHGGGNWRLGRTTGIEWNTRLWAELQRAEGLKGSLLNFSEIYTIAIRLMREYRIPADFVPFRD